MKYYLKNSPNGALFNAGSKAVNDANVILETNGYLPFVIKHDVVNRFLKLYRCTIFFIRIILKIRKRDTMFIQYPLYCFASSYIYKLLIYKGVNIEILVHDLHSLRGGHVNKKNERDLFDYAHKIILHSHQMSQLLTQEGVDKAKIKELHLFDYLTNSTNMHKSQFGNTITFAGNLSKSSFIYDLAKCEDLIFNLYGLSIPNLPQEENILYKGKFSPDIINDIEGDWGLVWDGDSIETCSGVNGEYLRVNSSHKASLYIACEKPVIVWSESALKDYVLEHNIGIAVDSILDISESIEELGEDKISSIKLNLKEYSKRLRSGNNLGQLLK